MTMCHRTYSMSGACDFSAGFFRTSHRHAATKATFARPAMEPHARETCCMQIMPPCNLECKDWGVHVAVNFVQVFLRADVTPTACGNQLQISSCSGNPAMCTFPIGTLQLFLGFCVPCAAMEVSPKLVPELAGTLTAHVHWYCTASIVVCCGCFYKTC